MEQPMIAPPVVPDDNDRTKPLVLAFIRDVNACVRPPVSLVPRQVRRFRRWLGDTCTDELTQSRYRVAQGDEPEAA